MRLATLIIGLVLALASGAQSCAVAYTSNVATELGRQAGQRTTETSTLSAGGAFGMVGAIAWIVAAGLVMSRPRVSTWIFGLAALPWVAAAVNDFSDAGVWAAVSIALALMARAGERELLKAKTAEAQAAVAPVAAASPPPGWYADPGGTGRRWWDGARWTEHRDS